MICKQGQELIEKAVEKVIAYSEVGISVLDKNEKELEENLKLLGIIKCFTPEIYKDIKNSDLLDCIYNKLKEK